MKEMNKEFNNVNNAAVGGRVVAVVDSILVIESKNSKALLNINSSVIQKPNFQVYLKDKKIGEIYDIIGNTKTPYFLAKTVKLDNVVIGKGNNSKNREEFIKYLMHKEILIKGPNKSNKLNAPKKYKNYKNYKK